MPGNIVESMGSLESGGEKRERLVISWTSYNVRTSAMCKIRGGMRINAYHVHIIDSPMVKKQK